MDDAFRPARRYLGKETSGFPEDVSGKSILNILLTSRPHIRIFGVVFVIAIVVTGIIAPYYQRIFIDELTKSSPVPQLITWMGFAVGFGILSQTLTVLMRILFSREGIISQRWLSRKLYDHALNLSSAARSKKTVGETVAHFATDVQTASAVLDDFFPVFLNAIGPIIGAPLALSYFYDIPLTLIFLVTFVSTAVCLVFSLRQARFFSRFKRLAEERISIVNEWLQNLRILRILGWVPSFERRIQKKREEETTNRLSMVTNGSVMNALAQAAPLLINAAGVYSLIEHYHGDVTPGDIFAVLWMLGVFLNRPMRMIPWTMVVLLDAKTSIRRLEAYFDLEREHNEFEKSTTNPVDSVNVESNSLAVQNVSFISDNRKILDVHKFSIREGEFVAIVGEVGAGKTIFLNALIRDLQVSFGRYSIGQRNALELSLHELRGHFAYVPQDGFVMSASIRENVLFEYDVDNSRDKEVMQALSLAQFSLNHENMAAGLDTEIGERGVNMSGGQKQRLALARAYVSDKPIILLDDCLSAVDVKTEEGLVRDLICGAWKNKTRILVTHRLSVLPYADRVLTMNEGRLQ